jgi:hypothetical protein
LYAAVPTESPRKNKPKNNKKDIPGVWPMFRATICQEFTNTSRSSKLFVALDARNTYFSIRPPKQQLFLIKDDPSNCRPKPLTIVYDAIEPERHCLYPENGAASRPRLAAEDVGGPGERHPLASRRIQAHGAGTK